MAFDPKFERVDDDDPNRCQHFIPTQGQCNLKACPGSQYCPAHGGNKSVQAAEKKSLRNYQLNKFRTRTAELGNSSEILSLKDEIGILRLLIEEKINQCHDNTDLLLMAGPLSDLIMKVDRVVTSCNKLESKLGNFLDKTAILNFAQQIIKIICNNVDDELVIEKISEEISQIME